MKRMFLLAVLALGLVLGSACGARTNSQGDSPNEELIVIGMSQVGAESDWRTPSP